MGTIPSGTVGERSLTFLFTDIEGSTRLWERYPASMSVALRQHDDILRIAISNHAGRVFKTVGDAIYAHFDSATDACRAALDARNGLTATDWSSMGLPEDIRVRMALHYGSAIEQGGDFAGPTLNRLSRLLNAANGGQVLATADLHCRVDPSDAPEVVFIDLGERRLRDIPGTQRVFQLSWPGVIEAFSPLRTLDQIPHNLPALPSKLIGRETERGKTITLLRDPQVRIVTLTGPGGIGKTRLALQVATDLVEEFPDGAWFVDLSNVRDSTQLPHAILHDVGVEDDAGPLGSESLNTWLKHRNLLLVLDNCEPVIERAASLVADIVRNAPMVSILVTSREFLHLRGERVMQLHPLSLPSSETQLDLAQLASVPAVELFVALATERRSDFALTAVNAADVAEICRRLEGIPLAIELAAVRIAVLSPRTLLQRLEQLLPMLSAGPRDLPDRHRTLSDAIRWSYDLLDPTEQQCFQGLATFAGGFTTRAAQAVIDPEQSLDTLDMLESLVNKSLIRSSPSAKEETRFSMLETIREFGQDRLISEKDAAIYRQRHAAHFLALAQESDVHLGTGKETGQWLNSLDSERANFREASNWFESVRDAPSALRLNSALWNYWSARGQIEEGRQAIARALSIPGNDEPELRARALRRLGNLSTDLGQLAIAKQFYEESLDIAQRDQLKQIIADDICSLGMIANMQRRYAEERVLLEQSLAMYRELEDEQGAAYALLNVAIGARDVGELERAKATHLEALDIQRRLGDDVEIAYSLCYLARVEADLGNYDDAARMLEDALRSFEQLDYSQGTAMAKHGLGVIALQQTNIDEAERLLLEVRAMLGTGNELPGVAAETSEALARVALARDLPYESLALLAEAVQIREQCGYPVSGADSSSLEAFERELKARVGERTFESRIAAKLSAH
jgi:predicted ATPase/class 3 adenylate cyclase